MAFLLRRMKAAAGRPSAHAFFINNLGSLDDLLPPTEDLSPTEVHMVGRFTPLCSSLAGCHAFTTLSGVMVYDLSYIQGQMTRQDAAAFADAVVGRITEMARGD